MISGFFKQYAVAWWDSYAKEEAEGIFTQISIFSPSTSLPDRHPVKQNYSLGRKFLQKKLFKSRKFSIFSNVSVAAIQKK